MDSLFLLQFSCFIITTFLFLLLVASRIFVKWVNDKYEHSRWLLAAALLIYSVHYLLQMTYGFRASGDDIGAVINILFYSPTIFLISYSIVNIECSKHNRKFYILVGVLGYLSIISIFVIGKLFYDSLHMPIALQVMRLLFFIIVMFFIFAPLHEARNIYLKIEKATGGDMRPYNMFLGTGFVLLSITAIMFTVAMLSNQYLYILAPIFFISIFMFILCFVALGFNIAILDEADIIATAEAEDNSTSYKTKTEVNLSQDKITEIEKILAHWRCQGLYRDSELTLTLLSNRIGVSRKVLTSFFNQKYHCTFRTWLSNIRFEEAKTLFMSHPEYSNDAISQECGFSSRGQLYNIFRDKTGMSPGEWKAINIDNKESK